MLLGTLILYAAAAAASVAEPRGACNHDNCLRGDYDFAQRASTTVLKSV
jgi:hypothetical protein